MADPYPLRPVGPEEFDVYHAVDDHAFHKPPLSPQRREERLRQFEADRGLAAFDRDRPVGIAGVYSLRMSVPGAIVPAAGVTWVAVLPSHRRRGILTSLMNRQLRDIRERGESFAVLWATEGGIYGRFGYGTASWQATFQLGRGDGVLARPAPGDGAGGGVRVV
jgi:predicted acetyltransferase